MTDAEKLAGLIPHGRENAISRDELSQLMGTGDRRTRRLIEQARADGVLICNGQDGRGYWISDDPEELLAQYKQDTARALNVLRRRKPLRKALIAAGVKIKN